MFFSQTKLFSPIGKCHRKVNSAVLYIIVNNIVVLAELESGIFFKTGARYKKGQEILEYTKEGFDCIKSRGTLTISKRVPHIRPVNAMLHGFTSNGFWLWSKSVCQYRVSFTMKLHKNSS